ncbi:hypothetical protein HKCCE4037_10955 [Rhodobacterales bacterium HKCCE4037]|nr:hypothetical protein [Rhodobacterales bacterium HKCCE4037]
MGLFDKWVRAEDDGQAIACVNTWFNGAAIYVNGVEVARSMETLALDEARPFVEAVVEGPNGALHIEMHILSILFTQIELRVNNRHVAGHRLVKEDVG